MQIKGTRYSYVTINKPIMEYQTNSIYSLASISWAGFNYHRDDQHGTYKMKACSYVTVTAMCIKLSLDSQYMM